MEITHSYQGLAKEYLQVRPGTPRFARFMIAHAGFNEINRRIPVSIVELGAGAGQQTEFVEKELKAAGLSHYRILAFDKSYGTGMNEGPSQLDLLADRIKRGEISDKVQPVQLDFDEKPLPVESESVDLCYMAWVLHHLRNQQMVINEVSRILRKGSGIFMYQVTIESMKNHPLDEFFPNKYEYEINRYPTRRQLQTMFSNAGFTFEKPHAIRNDDPRPIDRTFLEGIENTTFDSALRMIKDNNPAEFEEGVSRVRREVELAEKSGKYRIYTHNRRKVFWGIKK